MKSVASTRPTIQDIADQTGLSIATVSRALHHETSPNVSAKTRARVKEIARSMGYQPNLLGRSLVTGRSHTVSYWTQNIFSPYYVMITEQICWEAAQRKFYVMINGAHDPARTFEGVGAGFGNPLAANYDGVIGCDISYTDNHNAEALQHRGTPFVGIGLNTSPDHDSVQLDVYAGGRLAVEHLLAQGCKRIAHLTTHTVNDPRAQAYLDVMAEAGLQPEIIPIAYEKRSQAREEILAYVESQKSVGKPLPKAIFCKNDECAIGCFRALCEVGISVPHDILLIGCDGIPDAAFQSCSISTVQYPIAEMCRTAWDFLEARLKDNARPIEQVVLQPQLVVRESSVSSS